MSESLIFLSKLLFRSFLGKNKRFAPKTDERIPSPVGNRMLHWSSWESPPLLQSQEPVHYQVQLHLLRVPGSRFGVASDAGGPDNLLLHWVVVIFVPGRPVTYVLRAHFSVGVTSVRVADSLTIFLVSHLVHLHTYSLADYHTYIRVQ